jgi:hypothetical protein
MAFGSISEQSSTHCTKLLARKKNIWSIVQLALTLKKHNPALFKISFNQTSSIEHARANLH